MQVVAHELKRKENKQLEKKTKKQQGSRKDRMNNSVFYIRTDERRQPQTKLRSVNTVFGKNKPFFLHVKVKQPTLVSNPFLEPCNSQ